MKDLSQIYVFSQLLLQKYDFISAALQEYQVNASPEQFAQGVIDLQYMSGLEETGELDSRTLARISGRRCGNLDDMDEVRQRRSDNSQWRGIGKTDITWS